MSRVLPLYLVVFAGFVGYSLMIAIFTPMLLRSDGGMLPRSDSEAHPRPDPPRRLSSVPGSQLGSKRSRRGV